MKKTVRVIIPKNAGKLIVLALNIIAKHLADGVNSILNMLNMAEMQTLTDTAEQQHVLVTQLRNSAEKATENRNNAVGYPTIKSGTVRYYITSVRDMLLNLYIGSEHTLSDWGFEVNMGIEGPVVVIPTHIPHLITLARNILAKHTADGANSPINILNMADMLAKTDTAETNHNEAKTIEMQAEEATQKRNLALGHAPEQTSYTPNTVLFYVSAARDMLLAIYRGKEKELGKWGFTVDANLPSPPPPEPQITIAMATKQNPVTPVNMGVIGTNGEEATANYGDSTTETKTVNESTITYFSHLHSSIGNYSMQMIATILGLLEFYAPDCKISAINLPEGIKLRVLDLMNNLLASFFLPLSYVDMLSIQLNNNELDQASVNQVLIQLAANGLFNGSVNLGGGTNAAPSGQGIAAMNQLLSRGWTVITN